MVTTKRQAYGQIESFVTNAFAVLAGWRSAPNEAPMVFSVWGAVTIKRWSSSTGLSNGTRTIGLHIASLGLQHPQSARR